MTTELPLPAGVNVVRCDECRNGLIAEPGTRLVHQTDGSHVVIPNFNPESTPEERRERQLDELAAAVARKKGWTIRRARRWLERQEAKAKQAQEGG